MGLGGLGGSSFRGVPELGEGVIGFVGKLERARGWGKVIREPSDGVSWGERG